VNALDRSFQDWYADRDPSTPNSWWNGDHECDITCDCAIEAMATAIANDSLVIDDESEATNVAR